MGPGLARWVWPRLDGGGFPVSAGAKVTGRRRLLGSEPAPVASVLRRSAAAIADHGGGTQTVRTSGIAAMRIFTHAAAEPQRSANASATLVSASLLAMANPLTILALHSIRREQAASECTRRGWSGSI